LTPLHVFQLLGAPGRQPIVAPFATHSKPPFYAMQSMDFAVQSVDFALKSMDFVMQSMDFIVQSMDFVL